MRPGKRVCVRTIAKHTSLWTAKIAAVFIFLIAALVGASWWRLAAAPLELPALTALIEQELSDARGGRPVRIDRVDLSWSGEPGALQLKARGVHILAADGQELSTYREATIGLGGLPLLIGRVTLVRADFQGGEITVARKADGAMHIAFGPVGAPADIVVAPPDPNATLAERVNTVLDALAETLRPVGRAGRLQFVAIRDTQLQIVDEGGGGVWTADAADVTLTRARRALALAVDARLEGAEGTAPAQLRVTTDTAFRSALIEFVARDARPRALLSPAALGAFAALDAPLTAAITIGLDRDVGVNRFEGDLALGQGAAEMGGETMRLEGGRLHGRYDLEADELIIDEVALAGTRTRITGDARLANASALLKGEPGAAATFEAAFPSLVLDAPGVFAAPFELAQVRASGAIVPETGRIELNRLEATRGEARLNAEGAIRFARVGQADRLYPGFDLDARIEGPIEARTILSLWPARFIEGARSYLDDAIQGGMLNNVVLKLAIPPEQIAERRLRNEALNIAFDFDGGDVRFIDTMSPVTEARGSAVLQGNRFDLTVAGGRINGLSVTQGSVSIPVLNPKGEMATITATAEGDARNMVGLLLQEPLSLGEALPFDAASVSGRGRARLMLQRPNLSNVPFEALRFDVSADIENGGATLRENGMAVRDARIAVRGDQRAITISGPMRLADSQIDLNWTEQVRARGGPSSRYRIAGQFTVEDLETLGYPARAIARGRIGVDFSGQGRGLDAETGEINLDFRNASVFLPANYWVKRQGQPANARADIAAIEGGGYALSNISVDGSGISARGAVRLLEDGRVRDGDITRLNIDGRADLSATLRRGRDGALEIAGRGALADAAPFLDMEEPEVDAAAAAASAQNRFQTRPIRIVVSTERLALRGGAALMNAQTNVTLIDTALQTLILRGRTPQGKDVRLALGPRPGAPNGEIEFASADAGFAWRALTGADNIIGGVAEGRGAWAMGPPGVATMDVTMRDFRVVRVPAMAQMLGSVGSLTGFVSMLNGDGIAFNTLEASLTLNDRDLEVRQARLAGPSLGFTASGGYDMAQDDLDIDGVVIPSYGVNSLLSNIPLLGNLLASRRGEGVIGMTYAVNGPVAQPRVGVNPLSALTPGILRRIFEPFAGRRTRAPANDTAQRTTPPG